MKKIVPLILALSFVITANAQITTPIIRANFGVDADLRANFLNNAINRGNDDWFNNGTTGTGVTIIDTNGAAAIMAEYVADPTNRKKSFSRGMNFPMYSTINGKLLIDAVFVRDHYQYDSTSFSNSNKNAQSPALWSGGINTMPPKNDINDVMIHVRRDGPSLTDSLWFFAGLSLHGNTGNRYFDIELYQSDIYYNKTDSQFYNYGNAAGHTAWQFDGSGNVTQAGDVIFTAEFGSSSLTLLEARIWVDSSSRSITPTQFSWGTQFDGDGSNAQYGYANILPKNGGVFYAGNQSTNNTWAGPFGFVNLSNVLNVNYSARDYMEIAVNMTKLGLDPYMILGGNCGASFKKAFAKTRSSTSFTSELKDFVGPYSLGRPEATIATGNLSLFCGNGPGFSQLSVVNPLSTSTYTWSTPDGNIISSNQGTIIAANLPGTYIVTQSLQSGCSAYSSDTIVVIKDSSRCLILAAEDLQFSGRNKDEIVVLNWTTGANDVLKYEIERSTDNKSFQNIGIQMAGYETRKEKSYQFTDRVDHLNAGKIYYRLKITATNAMVNYSKTISVKNNNDLVAGFNISPNPASDYLQLNFKKDVRAGMLVRIYNNFGAEVKQLLLKNETERINLRDLTPGIYVVQAYATDGSFKAQQKLLVTR